MPTCTCVHVFVSMHSYVHVSVRSISARRVSRRSSKLDSNHAKSCHQDQSEEASCKRAGDIECNRGEEAVGKGVSRPQTMHRHVQRGL